MGHFPCPHTKPWGDFATGTISSGNTSFFSYCPHTKPWGLLCFPLFCNWDYLFWKHKLLLWLPTHQTLGSVMFDFAIGIMSPGNTSFFSYCLHIKTGGPALGYALLHHCPDLPWQVKHCPDCPDCQGNAQLCVLLILIHNKSWWFFCLPQIDFTLGTTSPGHTSSFLDMTYDMCHKLY